MMDLRTGEAPETIPRQYCADLLDSRTDPPARDHRVPESQRQRPDRSTYEERGRAERVSSYSAASLYDRDGGTRREEERGGSSMPRYTPRTDFNDEEQYGGSEGLLHDARTDAYWFPPNSVSASGIAQRRMSIIGHDSAADQRPPERYSSEPWFR